VARGRPSTKRLSDAEREKIADAIRDGKHRNEICREFGRSAGTVTKIAQDHGLAFDRSATKHATEALKVDNANAFEMAKNRLLEEFNKALDELHAPAESMKWHEGKLLQQQIPEPTFTDKRHIMFRANGAIQYALAIEHRTQGDDDTSQAAVNEWMESMRAEAKKRVAE
jgi:transposase-like protein